MPRPIVLVSLDWIRPGDPRTSLGTASIASSLRHAGVEVAIVADAVNRPGFAASPFIERVLRAVADAGPRTLLGIGAFVWNEPEVQALLPALRSQCEIVLGGPQISYSALGTLEPLYRDATYFVRGHGEAALVALALGRGANGELGLHVAGAEDRGTRADIALDQLPSPHLDGTLPVGSFVRWETQRGCPFSCTFCQHREAGARLTRRELGADRLHREIHAFAGTGVQRLAALDPVFHTNRVRAVALLQTMSEAGLRAEISLQCRAEVVDDSFLDGLDVVLEFGLQTIHDDEARAVGRPNRLDKVAAVFHQLHARAIPFEVSLIYGLPLQTLDRFRASVDWCLEHGVPRVRAWPLMLLRGTPLHAQRDRWGFIESYPDGRIPVVVASQTFSRDDHSQMASIASSLDAAPLPKLAA